MDREKLVVIIITVAVIAGAVGMTLGGMFTRPARNALDIAVAEVQNKANEYIAEMESEVAELRSQIAVANKARKAAVSDAKSAREQMRYTISQSANIRANNTRTVRSETKPKPVRQVNPAIATAVQSLLDEGLVYSVDVQFNEARIDPVVWSALDIEAKQNTVNLFSDFFDQSGSTGRVTILSNRNDDKLATFGVWGGMKILK